MDLNFMTNSEARAFKFSKKSKKSQRKNHGIDKSLDTIVKIS